MLRAQNASAFSDRNNDLPTYPLFNVNIVSEDFNETIAGS